MNQCMHYAVIILLCITHGLTLITENLIAEESYHMQKFTIRGELIALNIFIRKHAEIVSV